MKKTLLVLLMSSALCLGACSTNKATCSAEGKCSSCHRREMRYEKTPAYFAFDSVALTQKDKDNLDQIARRLHANPQERIIISGYADSTGPAAYNMKLSKHRAQVAATYLETQGIMADRISTRGYGASHFADANTTMAERAKNRRIEVTFEK